jgi:hypothetical protein
VLFIESYNDLLTYRKRKLSPMANTWNPSYLGLRSVGSWPAQAKKVFKDSSQWRNWACCCTSVIPGSGGNLEDHGTGHAGEKLFDQTKKGWNMLQALELEALSSNQSTVQKKKKEKKAWTKVDIHYFYKDGLKKTRRLESIHWPSFGKVERVKTLNNIWPEKKKKKP